MNRNERDITLIDNSLIRELDRPDKRFEIKLALRMMCFYYHRAIIPQFDESENGYWRSFCRPHKRWEIIMHIECFLYDISPSQEWYYYHRTSIAEVSYIIEQSMFAAATSQAMYLDLFFLRKHTEALLFAHALSVGIVTYFPGMIEEAKYVWNEPWPRHRLWYRHYIPTLKDAIHYLMAKLTVQINLWKNHSYWNVHTVIPAMNIISKVRKSGMKQTLSELTCILHVWLCICLSFKVQACNVRTLLWQR